VKRRKLVARGRDLTVALASLALGVAAVVVKGFTGLMVIILLVCVLVAAALFADATH
jgi:hypothetical protein